MLRPALLLSLFQQRSQHADGEAALWGPTRPVPLGHVDHEGERTVDRLRWAQAHEWASCGGTRCGSTKKCYYLRAGRCRSSQPQAHQPSPDLFLSARALRTSDEILPRVSRSAVSKV